MADPSLPQPDAHTYANFVRAQALALRAKDQAPRSRREWEERRTNLRQKMLDAMGSFPDKQCLLDAKVLGVLKRSGYRIEKLLFQSRPDIWVTASAYVPELLAGRVPAVLVVHGHWAWARRDPIVQARCLGLVKLGFFVLAVDAFGAGERHPTPAAGTYHGALFGSTLWPVGQTLLGMQVYDNRRAVDYLCSRPEVDSARIGITGASGGGNQSMYAGALDDRLAAVVPVCSVGTYQSYLHVACCVCEVLPGALRFTEEGEVLGLVAPRALMVVSATKDGFQFSVGEAKKSLERAQKIFALRDAPEKIRHAIFESPHDYNQSMRETMYGWMTRWLKNEGDGKPIPEPSHQLESPEDLRCLVGDNRPKEFLFPPTFAARQARFLLAKFSQKMPDHIEEWISTAMHMRAQLAQRIFADFPRPAELIARLGKPVIEGQITSIPVTLLPEPGMPMSVTMKRKDGKQRRQPACLLLHLSGKAEALKHPLALEFVNQGWTLIAPELRATGEARPANDAIAGASDHNSAEHGLWIGRPLLGQWIFEVSCLLDWMARQDNVDLDRLAVAGVGHAAVVALSTAGLFEDRVPITMITNTPVTYATDRAYALGFPMGLLAPGILTIGDVPHLAALLAPRPLVIADGVTPQGEKLTDERLRENFTFTREIYRLHKAEAKLSFPGAGRTAEIMSTLTSPQ